MKIINLQNFNKLMSIGNKEKNVLRYIVVKLKVKRKKNFKGSRIIKVICLYE